MHTELTVWCVANIPLTVPSSRERTGPVIVAKIYGWVSVSFEMSGDSIVRDFRILA